MGGQLELKQRQAGKVQGISLGDTEPAPLEGPVI